MGEEEGESKGVQTRRKIQSNLFQDLQFGLDGGQMLSD